MPGFKYFFRMMILLNASLIFSYEIAFAQPYWWQAPNLKYVEEMEEGTHGPQPHYWSFGGPSTTDSTSDQTYLYTSDAANRTFFSQYVVAELRSAENADQVTHRWAIDHIYGLPKGSSQFGDRLVIGNGGEEDVPFVSYPDDYTLGSGVEVLLDADVLPTCDTLYFNHDGSILYTNHYVGGANRMKLHRYEVIAPLDTDGEAFRLDDGWQDGGTFNTSLGRLRNFAVKYIGGKDLIYYAEGDTTANPSNLYVFDPETGEERLLAGGVFSPGEVQDADAVNVKIAGIQNNDLHIFVMANIGGVKIYKLSADGMSVENGGEPVAFLSIDDLNEITDYEAFSSHCRAFEVTDDQQYAFFSSHNANDRIFVVNTEATGVKDWMRK